VRFLEQGGAGKIAGLLPVLGGVGLSTTSRAGVFAAVLHTDAVLQPRLKTAAVL
jgi:hypothetical protein